MTEEFKYVDEAKLRAVFSKKALPEEVESLIRGMDDMVDSIVNPNHPKPWHLAQEEAIARREVSDKALADSGVQVFLPQR